MSRPAVELLLLWHHHQPDYRSPRTGRALLPWVRLHASKDYLDMALRLERHPRVRATFNFVPILLDQLDDVAADGGDVLFERLATPAAELAPDDRRERLRRTAAIPPRLIEPWPAAAALAARAARSVATGGDLADADLDTLAAWFLVAWVDPMFHDDPAVRAALREGPARAHVPALIALHRRLAGEVVPAYRRMAASGQIELSASPYAHPILPLLVDTACARRAQADLALPSPGFAFPEDAVRQVERALVRHAAAFGERPAGMWPSEGSVSPEIAAIVAARGVRWLATDEGVLWRSLESAERKRDLLYQPWRCSTSGGDVTLFFRDHELSDRIGFVYSHWDAADAVADFLGRLRRIGEEHVGEEPPLVTVALDGENCWEHYAGDGGPFLDALYAGLTAAADIATVTPSGAIESRGSGAPLGFLHTGSWIDADFHIWIGHPEKNRAWERIAQTRADLVASGTTEAGASGAWEALHAAEGSDWFWWFGTDHHTPDKPVFDVLLREHLSATYERRGAAVPERLREPIIHDGGRRDETGPIGWLRPIVDGRETSYYEWRSAGRHRPAAGSAMHRGESPFREVYWGFDERHLYLRLDPPAGPGRGGELAIAMTTPAGPVALRTRTDPGAHAIRLLADPGAVGNPIEGARCVRDAVIEMVVPLRAVGLGAGDRIALALIADPGTAREARMDLGQEAPIRVMRPGDAAADWIV